MIAYLGALALAGVAIAAAVAYSRSLTAASPTYNRPETSPASFANDCGAPTTLSTTTGTAVHYDAQTFTVGTTGTYDLVNVSNTFGDLSDSYLALYQGSFDPATPLTNVLYANDDGAALSSGRRSPARSRLE